MIGTLPKLHASMPSPIPAFDLERKSNDGHLGSFLYSVVIPVYQSERTIGEVIVRTAELFKKLDLKYEIIAVDDGSTDQSRQVITKCADADKNVTAISLVKNYGQQSAILCGLFYSKGDYVINLDDDLQNPPEEVEKLITKAAQGYDLVCGVYHQKKHPLFRQLGSKLINKVNERIFGKPRDFRLTNFRIMNRSLVERICNYRTAFPYISGLAMLLSGKRANVLVNHQERLEGRSTYTFAKILNLVAAILLNYSSFPLRFLCYCGLIISAASFLFGAIVVLRELLGYSKVLGWTSLVLLLSFYNGFLILMLGLVGEYTMRILNTIAITQSFSVMDIYKRDEA
jgi:glycosyltransferase involved in cell wall biosynthesis